MKFSNKSILAVFVVATMLATQALAALPTIVAAQKHAKTRGLSEEQRIIHVLNRLGFGARPGDVERVKSIGLENYINQQLAPEKISDTVAENKIKDLSVLTMTTALFLTGRTSIKGCEKSPEWSLTSLSTAFISVAYGRPERAACCAFRILDAATICIALVICDVFLIDLIRRRISRVLGMSRV